MGDSKKAEWLLLIHQIPPKPDYFRVKIWRRLQKVGAVAIKQSVYVLPSNDQSYEDLHWIVKEITEGGGTASLAKTVFLEGLSCEQIESIFQAAREAEYEEIINDTISFLSGVTDALENAGSVGLKKKRALSRIQRRFAEIESIDFFDAPGREAAEKILKECEILLRKTKENTTPAAKELLKMSGQTWVTRRGIYVDRIASGWLIRRFIDREGQFKFVADERYRPQPGELRFDMFEGEFTHVGDSCTFEVLVESFGLKSQPLVSIAEIIHDIDLKDGKYGRPEVMGVQAVFSGLATTCSDDQDRLERGSMILDELYASFGGIVEK